jgi:FlaA1/EpsC-like NDP-sugar epimerase
MIVLLVWPVSIPITFAVRSALRSRLVAVGRFGVPIAVIGTGSAARMTIRELLKAPKLGYKPVAVFSSGKSAEPGTKVLGIPIVGDAAGAVSFQFPYPRK